MRWMAYVAAGSAMFLVGTLAGVSGMVNDYPIYGGQALRYALSAVLFLIVARAKGLSLIRPRPREVVLLLALTATGLVFFNICVITATRHAHPATVGTIIGAVPILLALAGPTFSRTRPSRRVVGAAVVVVIGTAITSGFGTADTAGILLSAGALVCEACFTLLAIPLLVRLGPVRVSGYTSATAVPMLLVTALLTDRDQILRMPTLTELAGFLYLALIVGGVAFLLWYGAMPRLGADRAGLFAGLVPIGSIAASAALGLAEPSPAELLGATVVITGLLIGLAPSRRPASTPARACR
ncbi:DMT family transporter [Kribbella sp. WER1]